MYEFNYHSPSSIDEGQSTTVSGTFTDPALGVGSETFTGLQQLFTN